MNIHLKLNYKRMISCCIIICVIGVQATVSQTGQNSNSRRPLGPEDTSKTPREEREKPYFSPAIPVTCEEARVYLEDAAERVRGDKDTVLIVIARVGNKESASHLNHKRLKIVQSYLSRHPDLKLITAAGTKVAGEGRIELYVRGQLLYSIPIRKNSASVCIRTGVG